VLHVQDVEYELELQAKEEVEDIVEELPEPLNQE
jgi:hypothetical protein